MPCLRYSKTFANPDKLAKARGNNLSISFKNTRETAAALHGMSLKATRKYLEDVIEHKDIIPFRRHKSGVGRKAQAIKYGTDQGRWPEKSCRFFLDLIKNAESNAVQKKLDVNKLRLVHVQVNHAPRGRRRTYRAHGRINPFMSLPSHVEMIYEEQESKKVKGSLPGNGKHRKVSKAQAEKKKKKAVKA